jgi:nucleoside-diphosphate-sugar epimerase
VAVVHTAALTEWGQPKDRYEAVNVAGTRHVTELAAAASVPVHYVSTAFVAALGEATPEPPRHDNVILPYIRSKRAGELMLAESGVPYSVYRPTNLIGDSVTGRTARPQIVQILSDWVCRGKARIFPVPPDDLLDIVPQDLLARAVVRALTRGETGGEYWITHGAGAMTMRTAVDVIVEHARSLGRDVLRPLLLHPAELTADDLASVPPMSRMFMRVLTDVRQVVAACGGVLPSSLDLLATRFGLTPMVSDVEAFRRTLAAAGCPAVAPRTRRGQ